MSRSSSAPSLQLFPFLAVLVCAMGALILLLLVMTPKMRYVAQDHAALAVAPPQDVVQPPLPQLEPEPVRRGPSQEEVAAIDAARRARRTANAAARRRQSERDAKWQRQIAEAEIARDQRRQQVQESEAELDNLRQRLQVTESNLSKLRDKKSKIKSLQDYDAKALAQAQTEHEKLADSIVTAQKKLADLRRAHAEAGSRYAFIPYDGASGTSRRPLYVECTSGGIRFQPENELLDESDLKGFTETYNPLLLACENLMQYWREQAATGEDRGHPMRPYVLLVVRPKGTISYYVARKMLSQLGDDFGYELIEEDFPLQLPPPDPEAKLVIRRSIAEALKSRGEMLAIGGRPGEARLGQVLMGRNEELIEFGTLDDQVAATTATQESPFAKTPPVSGKAFSVTRSPIGENDMQSRSFRAAQAEQQRRRANGEGSNLGSVGDQASAPENHVPGSLAEMTRQPPGNGPVALRPNSGPIRAGDPRTYALSDPYSRQQFASGDGDSAGVIDPADAQAGGSGGNPGAGTAGSSGRRGRPIAGAQDSSGAPRGARPGKVIDIASSATPIANASGAAGDANGGNGDGGGGAPGGAGSSGRRGRSAANSAHSGTALGGSDGSDGDSGPGGPDSGESSNGQSHSAGSSGASNGQLATGKRGPSSGTSGADSSSAAGGSDGSLQQGGPVGASNSPSQNSGQVTDATHRQQFGKPAKVQDGSQGANAADGSDAPPTGQRGRAGTPAFSAGGTSDQSAGQNRSYGDNPEARQQLAKAKGVSKSTATMQKHDAARRRWGGTNTGQIGFERKVSVQVMADKIVIGKNDVEVVVEPGTTQDELVESVLSGLDELSRTWGKPPTRFYWVPYLDFQVYAGGTSNYERLNGALRDWGIYSESKIMTGDKPVASASAEGTSQPAKDANAQPIGPAELDGKKAGSAPVPAKKSTFNWFKRITQGAFRF